VRDTVAHSSTHCYQQRWWAVINPKPHELCACSERNYQHFRHTDCRRHGVSFRSIAKRLVELVVLAVGAVAFAVLDVIDDELVISHTNFFVYADHVLYAAANAEPNDFRHR
jgi:hypothetical protein